MTDPAKTFRDLHHAAEPLLLANAWDAGSARLIESLGAPAVATTSAGIDWALGYPDGNLLPVAQLAAMAASITRLIRIPLSASRKPWPAPKHIARPAPTDCSRRA